VGQGCPLSLCLGGEGAGRETLVNLVHAVSQGKVVISRDEGRVWVGLSVRATLACAPAERRRRPGARA
jgi:thymidylate kinase